MAVVRMRVTVDGLCLRAEPKLTGKVLAGLDKGEVVRRISTSGDGYWQKIRRKSGKEGWAANKYLVSLANEGQIDAAEEFAWMPVAIREIGVREYAGAADNPRVVDYLCSTSLGEPERSNDETFWCSAFVNWCVERAGYAGTDSAWARSWLSWGKKVTNPRRGCIAVFRRGSGGHVAFFLDQTDSEVRVLGGNQSDQVSIADYAKANLLGYRIPA